jgi:hypothetical protein
MTALRPAALLLASALAGGTAVPQSDAKLDMSTKALTARAAAYVADYQTKFAFLVADERYKQNVQDADGSTRRRLMTGELFLTFLKTDREWMAVHDVAEIDGAPVPDRDNLQTLLQRGDIASIALRVARRNAAFNIGRVERNFNEPTLALLLLEAKRMSRSRFDRGPVSQVGGVTLVTLKFIEHDPPTLIRSDANHNAVFASGEIVMEADTGRIRHTSITFRDEPVRGELTTDYAPDARLGLWVPTVFTERYDLNLKPKEVITCEAIYSNYRRFDVTGRIK